ncbi:hypothetical protein [Rubellimicrobium roseum]|uniref:Uncharacterized protein n=1 Tax=Rubellimicrobium roseum TaxID=687525 RepID=A0A5C4N4P2_9RHOB|nr:hypothetical protein [Rubellimicrobium roseum]TNC63114.1 hypothetical protein FHG71_19705 [Rubellimicrobium roseum]
MTEPSKKTPGFFAVDVHQLDQIRAKNLGVEEAAAYLSLMVSTDQSNIISRGGIHSVTEYTGLTRSEAKRAIQRLEQHGLVRSLEVERKRARTVSRYDIPIHDSRKPLAGKERLLVEAIAAGQQPEGKVELNAAQRAKEKGYIEKRSDGWHILEQVNEVAFIPNSFVRVSSGSSPLARLVNNGELGPILLAVELYRLQNLMDDRGVPHEVIRGYFDGQAYPVPSDLLQRHKLHILSPGRVYRDASGKENSLNQSCEPHRFRDYNRDTFWRSLTALKEAHVVEWVVYSANGKPSGDRYAYNRPQRLLGVLRNDRHALSTPESRPAFLAYLVWCVRTAGQAYLNRSLSDLIEEWRRHSPIIAVENASVAHVEGISILRMTHRAATENTRVWYRDLCQECDDALFFIAEAARPSFPQVSALEQRLRGMKTLEEAIST